MGLFDSVWVPCPKCGDTNEFQSKGGACIMAEYTLENAPADVMSNVNRHAPIECHRCCTRYRVDLKLMPVPVAVEAKPNED